MGDILANRPIQMKGDGTPVRSYLYAADMMLYLWTILFMGLDANAYNVGSEFQVTIGQLMDIMNTTPTRRKTKDAPRYVPSMAKARQELGLCEHFGLIESIQKTLKWHRALE